jgi:hypothetical protein
MTRLLQQITKTTACPIAIRSAAKLSVCARRTQTGEEGLPVDPQFSFLAPRTPRRCHLEWHPEGEVVYGYSSGKSLLPAETSYGIEP